MNQTQFAYKKLVAHEFTQLALHQAVDIVKQLQTGDITKVEAKFVRQPDEYEFYLLETGRMLTQLLGLCEQLIHTALFLSAFSPTKKMKEAGITRASHVKYNIENFLIRTQSLHDRLLKLVNAVFHLGLSARDCKHDVVVKNLHVKVTEVPNRLHSLRKLFGRYQQDRNMIIHHESYSADDLRKLELYFLVQDKEDNSNDEVFLYATKSLTRKIVDQKIEEFDKFSEIVLQQIELLLDELKPIYENTADSLRLKCNNLPPNKNS